jgi:hypothetical protein
VPAFARGPKLQKYPLRVHVLASDETHRSPRMSAGEAVACDGVGDMFGAGGSSADASSSSPVRVSGDPCSLNPGVVVEQWMAPLDEQPIFSGQGRGDLVTPPGSTVGITFDYDDCLRVRVLSGFASLPARWKKPGKLEVLFPSDAIPVRGKALPPVRCSLRVMEHDYVYLRLGNGRIVEVSQQLFWSKPALRVFLSGGAAAVKQRPSQVVDVAQPVKSTGQ